MTPDYFEKSDGQEPSTEKHFVDDPEMIYRWEIDSLSPEKQDLLIEHYSDCPRCQAHLRELFPEVTEEDLPLLQEIPKDHPALVRLFDQIPMDYLTAAVERLKAEVISNGNRDDSGRKRRLYRLLAGVAALAPIFVATLSRQTPEPDLTVFHLDLKNGSYRTVWRQLESMQNEFHPKSEAFQRLFEEGGYLCSSDRLRRSEQKEIKHILCKLEESANLTGRVLKLEIQAERRKFNEYTTSSKRFLIDYGIALTGTSFIKGSDERWKAFSRCIAAIFRHKEFAFELRAISLGIRSGCRIATNGRGSAGRKPGRFGSTKRLRHGVISRRNVRRIERCFSSDARARPESKGNTREPNDLLYGIE